MANAYTYSNTALATTLAGSISSGALTVTVAATTGFPGTYPYVLALDYGAATEELILVSAAAGANLTCTRAFGGTSAQSHSLGAVVRHVINAVDMTDFRTHEAATAAHGVTGSIVGTSSSQTLTNKTLTSPTVNSGAMSGTFTGAHTYSGAVTLSGGGTLTGTFTGSPTLSGTIGHTGTIQSTQSASTNVALASIVTADSFDRFRLDGAGKHEWGPGSGARDVTLYRNGANLLATDDTLQLIEAASTTSALQTRVTGDTQPRLSVDAAGKMAWSTGALAADVDLSRTAAGWLSLNSNLYVASQIDVSSGTAHWGETGVKSFTFAASTSSTQAVTFVSPFDTIPRVVCNINSTAGSTLQWTAKAGGISTTGFTLIVSGPSVAWTAVEVQWAAMAAV